MSQSQKILLISLQVDLSVLGLKYLHSWLQRAGYQSYFLQLPNFNSNHRATLENLGEWVSELNPLFVGISLMSVEYSRARALSDYLKKRFPKMPLLWGGIHPTIAPETCFPFADYVCIGEGEKTILDFANSLSSGLDPRTIPNLCYLAEGEVKRNPLYPLIEDLDSLPFIEHLPKNGFLQEADGKIKPLDEKLARRYGRYQHKFYDLSTSRGCPFSCTYCCNDFFSRLYHSKKIRKRSLENIILELEKAIQDYPFIQAINFHDDNFLSRSLEFFKGFRDAYLKRVGKPFMFDSIPLYVTREKIALLKEAGLNWVRMGLQSGSDRVLKEVFQRKSLTKHFLNAVEIFKEFGIGLYCDVIIDNPFESQEDQLETIRVLLQTPRPYHLQLYSLLPFYGTSLYERIRKECPEKLKDPHLDYREYEHNAINNLIRLSPYLPRKIISQLVEFYQRAPDRWLFKLLLFVANSLNFLFFEQISILRLLLLSQGYSVKKLLKVIPLYWRRWVERYTKSFPSG